MWLLRWREAVTLPIVGGILGLGLASVIYTHRRLEREIEAKQRLEDDLQVASRIQQSLLQSRVPERSWVETHALNIASRQVGGDYYEIVDAGDAGICFAVGDVSGKGVPAALLMSSLQSAFPGRLCGRSATGSSLHPGESIPWSSARRPNATPRSSSASCRQRATCATSTPAITPPSCSVTGPRNASWEAACPWACSTTANTRSRNGTSATTISWWCTRTASRKRPTPPRRSSARERLAKIVSSHGGGSAADIASAVLDGIRSHSGTSSADHDDITLLVLRPKVGMA